MDLPLSSGPVARRQHYTRKIRLIGSYGSGERDCAEQPQSSRSSTTGCPIGEHQQLNRLPEPRPISLDRYSSSFSNLLSSAMTSPTTNAAPPRPVYNSFASRKRSSPPVKPLPKEVAWLKDIKLEMTTTNSIRASVYYIVRVIYQPTGALPTSWDVKRTFDEYKWFQKRLVGHLQPKHSCKAECRWLHTTIKKHFPKPTLGSRYPPVVEQRRKALLQLLTTVQASIVNHGNRNCKVMMEAVSLELSSFLAGDDNQGDVDVAVGVTPPVTPLTSSEMETSAGSRPSFTSSVTSEEIEEDAVNYDADTFTGWSLPIGHLELVHTNSPV